MAKVKKFGPFVIDHLIGRGGMGAVFRAHREDNGQVVAVKALLLPLEQERERFSAEIATLKLLRHDNIVRLYGFGQEDGVLYYAMEFVDGPSLATLLKKGRRFTWEEVAYIGVGVCNALKHAHDRGVVHRDIKPANIMLIDGGVVKVSDYGIAQYFGSSRLTGANQVVGTIEYMAPEQAYGGSLTLHTDMYAFGALMYVLLTGKPPYVARDLPQLLRQFKQGPPESIRVLRPEIPKVVDDLVFDLLQIQTTKRPSDARIVKRRLEALLLMSTNYPDGKPFKNKKFSWKGLEENSDSRVDLTEPTGTEGEADSFENLDPCIKDIPYSPIDEEDSEKAAPSNSLFEQTTQLASEKDFPTVAKNDSNDEGFSLSDETNGGNGESSRGNTPTITNVVSETDDDFETASDLSDDAVAEPTRLFDPNLDDPRNSTLGFDVSPEISDPGSETLAPDAENLQKGDSERRNRSETPTIVSKYDAPTVDSADSEEELETTAPSTVNESDNRSCQDNPAVDVQALIDKNAAQREDDKPDEFKDSDEVEATPLSKFKKSEFTPVNEDELGDLPKNNDEGPAPWYVWLRIPTMALVFLGIVLLTADMFKPPTADKLFAGFNKKFEACASAAKLSAELEREKDDLRRFVEYYPDDPRAERVRFFLSEIELNKLEKNLKEDMQKTGPLANVLPVQRAYVEACRAVAKDWREGRDKLRAFIILFGSEDLHFDSIDRVLEEQRENLGFIKKPAYSEGNKISNSKTKGKTKQTKNAWVSWNGSVRPGLTLQEQLVILAKRQLVKLQLETKETDLADLALLNDRIERAEDLVENDPERADDMKRAAVLLYGDKEWAAGALEPIKRDLEDSLADSLSQEPVETPEVLDEPSSQEPVETHDTLNESSSQETVETPDIPDESPSQESVETPDILDESPSQETVETPEQILDASAEQLEEGKEDGPDSE